MPSVEFGQVHRVYKTLCFVIGNTYLYVNAGDIPRLGQEKVSLFLADDWEKGPEEVGVAQPSKSGKALNLLYGGWLYFVPLKALRNLVEGKTDKASVMLPVPSGGF